MATQVAGASYVDVGESEARRNAKLSIEYADDSSSHRGRPSGEGSDGHCNGRSSAAGVVLNGVRDAARVTSTFYGNGRRVRRILPRRTQSYGQRRGDRVASSSVSSIDSVLRRQTSGLAQASAVDDKERRHRNGTRVAQ